MIQCWGFFIRFFCNKVQYYFKWSGVFIKKIYPVSILKTIG